MCGLSPKKLVTVQRFFSDVLQKLNQKGRHGFSASTKSKGGYNIKPETMKSGVIFLVFCTFDF